MNVCVCVVTMKKVPDEWQARQATPAILNQHMLQSTCFRTLIETGVDSKDDARVCVSACVGDLPVGIS